MKATIIIIHEEHKERQIKPKSITLITKTGKQKRMEWQTDTAIYKRGTTHIVTGGIKIKDPNAKKATPGANMGWVKKNIKHAYLSDFLSADDSTEVNVPVKLKSCILCEMHPDHTKTHYGIPIKHE